MAHKVYGRSLRSSGGPTNHHIRKATYFTDVSRSKYVAPKPGLTGPKVTITEGMEHPRASHMRTHYSNKHLRLRTLACGHRVFMISSQWPDGTEVCSQCEEGKPIR